METSRNNGDALRTSGTRPQKPGGTETRKEGTETGTALKSQEKSKETAQSQGGTAEQLEKEHGKEKSHYFFPSHASFWVRCFVSGFCERERESGLLLTAFC